MSHGFFLSFSKIISGTEFALRTLFWDFWIPFWLFELFRITGVLVQSIINKIQSIWILVPKWPKISVIFDVKIQVQVSWCTHLIRGNFGFVMMNGNTRWHSNSLTHFLQFERKRQLVFLWVDSFKVFSTKFVINESRNFYFCFSDSWLLSSRKEWVESFRHRPIY